MTKKVMYIMLASSLFFLASCTKPGEKTETATSTSGSQSLKSTNSSSSSEDTNETTESETVKMVKEYQKGSLLSAVGAEDYGKVSTILAEENVEIDETNEKGETPLLVAVHQNSVEIAKLLIDHGADINQQDTIQDSPYLFAGAEGRLEILTEMLAKSQPDYSVYNRYGGNALIPAAEKGHLETVKLLLKTGQEDVNHQNTPGYTALIEAVALNDGSKLYQDISKELLNHGADKSLRDASGKTAMDYAQLYGYTELIGLLK